MSKVSDYRLYFNLYSSIYIYHKIEFLMTHYDYNDDNVNKNYLKLFKSDDTVTNSKKFIIV